MTIPIDLAHRPYNSVYALHWYDVCMCTCAGYVCQQTAAIKCCSLSLCIIASRLQHQSPHALDQRLVHSVPCTQATCAQNTLCVVSEGRAGGRAHVTEQAMATDKRQLYANLSRVIDIYTSRGSGRGITDISPRLEVPLDKIPPTSRRRRTVQQ